MSALSDNIFHFLLLLKENNSREWFLKNRSLYEKAKEEVTMFAEEMLDELRKYDEIETISGKKSLYRIYRDVRFSKNKQLYKTGWSGSFKRATKLRRGGYYFHLEPGNTFIAGGFFGPNSDDLRHIRKHIDQDEGPLNSALDSRDIRQYFGKLQGDKVKTAPRGYTEKNNAIKLLRYKQFILRHDFTDEEVSKQHFASIAAKGFSKLLPFFDVMSEYLTTDLNGVSLD
jgi:uncharacterized protein (TIGR02453 family)